MKITAITCCGCYEQPWIRQGIAALYNAVDEIVVVNSGIDINNPDPDVVIPIPGIKEYLKTIDINNKIIVVENVDWESAGRQVQKNREDVRGLNLTLATQTATERGADWIFKYDTDQVMYPVKRNTLYKLTQIGHSGYIFWEIKDFWVDPRLQRTAPPAGKDYSDGPKFYKSLDDQWFVGQGAPTTWTEQIHSMDVVSSHVRECFPLDWTVEQKKRGYYERLWYRYYQANYLGEFKNKKDPVSLEVIDKECRSRVEGWYNTPRSIQHDPPRALLMDPMEYIKLENPTN
tara:strand:- start:1043 stop:1906 length:864 start_codon:yes stop_codon:yes gene_type:complete